LIKVDKTLKSADREKGNRFKEAIKPIIDGVEGCSIKVSAPVG